MLNTHSCGARWGGAGRCHCAGCHETFSSDSAWTRHRRGLACRDPRDAGLVAADAPQAADHGGTGAGQRIFALAGRSLHHQRGAVVAAEVAAVGGKAG